VSHPSITELCADTPVSKNYWQLFLSHTCVGLAGSLIYAPATAVAGQWFLRRRSTAVALVAAGSGLGGICYPLMLKSLIERLSESPFRLLMTQRHLLMWQTSATPF